MPSSLVFVVDVKFVAFWITLTEQLGTIAPVESVTRPVIVEVPICAIIMAVVKQSSSNILFILPLINLTDFPRR